MLLFIDEKTTFNNSCFETKGLNYITVFTAGMFFLLAGSLAAGIALRSEAFDLCELLFHLILLSGVITAILSIAKKHQDLAVLIQAFSHFVWGLIHISASGSIAALVLPGLLYISIPMVALIHKKNIRGFVISMTVFICVCLIVILRYQSENIALNFKGFGMGEQYNWYTYNDTILLLLFYIFLSYRNSRLFRHDRCIQHIMEYALDTARDGYLFLSKDKTIITFNKTIINLTGYSEKELQGKPAEIIIPNTNRLNWLNSVQTEPGKGGIVIKRKNAARIELESDCIRMLEKPEVHILTIRPPVENEELAKQLETKNKQISSYNRQLLNNHRALLNILEDMSEKNEAIRIAEQKAVKLLQKLEGNINQAKQYQSDLVRFKQPLHHNIRTENSYLPSDKIGGDFYNLIQHGSTLIVYIADIAGHGISAAILSSYIKSLLDYLILKNTEAPPSRILKELETALLNEILFKNIHFSIFIGKMNLDTLELQYSNAGHVPPLFYDRRTKKMITAESTNRSVNSFLWNNIFTDHTLALTSHTTGLFYTDGLIEWITPEDEVFGMSGLRRHLKAAPDTFDWLDNITTQQIPPNHGDDISWIAFDMRTDFHKIYFAQETGAPTILTEFEKIVHNRYDQTFLFTVAQCFDEVINNACEHGGSGKPDSTITVDCYFEKEKLTFSVADDGPGFDYSNFLTKEADVSSERTRGLYLVKHFANELHFNNTGNRVTCIFIHRRAA